MMNYFVILYSLGIRFTNVHYNAESRLPWKFHFNYFDYRVFILISFLSYCLNQTLKFSSVFRNFNKENYLRIK